MALVACSRNGHEARNMEEIGEHKGERLGLGKPTQQGRTETGFKMVTLCMETHKTSN